MITQEQYNYCLDKIKQIVPPNEAEDVLHEILLQVLGEGSKINDVPAYIISSAYRSYYSKTSPYARKYKQMIYCSTDDQIEDEVQDGDIFNKYDIDIVSEIDSFEGVCWWEKEVVKRKILENKTFRELEVEYNIPGSQIQYSFYKTIKKLKKYILQKYG